MDRLKFLEQNLLGNLEITNNKFGERYKKISQELKIKKMKFISQLNTIEEEIIVKSEDKKTNSLLDSI